MTALALTIAALMVSSASIAIAVVALLAARDADFNARVLQVELEAVREQAIRHD